MGLTSQGGTRWRIPPKHAQSGNSAQADLLKAAGKKVQVSSRDKRRCRSQTTSAADAGASHVIAALMHVRIPQNLMKLSRHTSKVTLSWHDTSGLLCRTSLEFQPCGTHPHGYHFSRDGSGRTRQLLQVPVLQVWSAPASDGLCIHMTAISHEPGRAEHRNQVLIRSPCMSSPFSFFLPSSLSWSGERG